MNNVTHAWYPGDRCLAGACTSMPQNLDFQGLSPLASNAQQRYFSWETPSGNHAEEILWKSNRLFTVNIAIFTIRKCWVWHHGEGYHWLFCVWIALCTNIFSLLAQLFSFVLRNSKKKKTGSTNHAHLHPAEVGQLLSHAPAKHTAGKCLGGSAVPETSPPLAANLSPSEANKQIFLLSVQSRYKKYIYIKNWPMPWLR